MLNIGSIHSRKKRSFLWVLLLGVIPINFSQPGFAAVSWYPWDPARNYIIRNEEYLAQPLPEIRPECDGTLEYNFVEDVHMDISIAHSGSAADESRLIQHVYAYNLPAAGTKYYVRNVTGHEQTLMFSEEMTGKKTGKRFRVKTQQINLDGTPISLLVIKSPDHQDQRGVLASFEFQAIREFERQTRRGIKIIKRKGPKGKVELIRKKNGKIKIKTRGKIKRRHIAAVQNENGLAEKGPGGKIRKRDIKRIQQQGDLFRIDLSDLVIPYKYYTRVGRVDTINVKLTSFVASPARGSAAEVNYTPHEPVVPDYHKNARIPEPLAALSLGLGVLFVFTRKKSPAGKIKKIQPRVPRDMFIGKICLCKY